MSFSFSECEKDLLSYLLHGKHEIFAGLDKASADDTYRSVNNLWNSYPKDEVRDMFIFLCLNSTMDYMCNLSSS